MADHPEYSQRYQHPVPRLPPPVDRYRLHDLHVSSRIDHRTHERPQRFVNRRSPHTPSPTDARRHIARTRVESLTCPRSSSMACRAIDWNHILTGRSPPPATMSSCTLLITLGLRDAVILETSPPHKGRCRPAIRRQHQFFIRYVLANA